MLTCKTTSLYGAVTKKTHNTRVNAVLDRIHQAGLKLNEKKCLFGLTELVFLGHVFPDQGVKPDPMKIEAIQDMPKSNSKQDLQHLLGMVKYLEKFISNLSETKNPLCQLLDSDVQWHWSNHHNVIPQQVKRSLTKSPTLKYYNPKLQTKISVDASKSGLGAVMLQKHEDTLAPVAYANRALRKSEQNYAQTEKETLSILFGCECFDVYLHRKPFIVESDHKPLQPTFTKPICKAPPRVQRFLMKLQKFDMEIQFKPGKELPVADTLLRAFIPAKECDAEDEGEYQVHLVMSTLPISNQQINRFQQETVQDKTIQSLKEIIRAGWRQRTENLLNHIKPFFNIQDESKNS